MVVPVDFVMSLSHFSLMLSSRKLACDAIIHPRRHSDVTTYVTFAEVW